MRKSCTKSGCSGGREGRRRCTFLNFVQAHILAQPTNVVLVNSSQYITSCSLTLRQVSTSNSYKTFRIPYHRGPKRPDAEFEKTVKHRPSLPVRMFSKRIPSSKFQPYVNTFYPPTEPARSMSPELNFSPRLSFLFLLQHVWLAISAMNTPRVSCAIKIGGFDLHVQRFSKRCSWSIKIS